MKISIITVCKNAENSIEKTFQSVFNQIYKNIEYIVIDGCSTDETLNIIEKYRHKIDVILSEQDTGIYNAMNKGVKLAKGDILYFLNSDDSLYDENVFQDVISTFEKYKTDIVFGNMFCSNKKMLHENQVNMKPEDIYKYNFFKSGFSFLEQSICQQVIFYKADLFKKYGFYDENYKIYGDWEINVRFMLKNNCVCKYIDRTIADFELGGISTKKTSKTDNIRKSEFDKIMNIYLKREFFLNETILKKFHYFMSKYFRSLLRLYESDKKFKNIIDSTIENFLFAQKINFTDIKY